VTLHGGEELQLERAGDLGEGNAGMLIFVDGRERPEYVPWTDVEQVDLDRPPGASCPGRADRRRALLRDRQVIYARADVSAVRVMVLPLVTKRSQGGAVVLRF
jgi:hypothetical protein